jgi:hypothetical protein
MFDQEIESKIEEYVGNYYGPNSEARVAAVEEELGLVLPRSYRIFLRRFGAAVCEGHMIAGLPDTRNTGPEPPFWDHVVDSRRSLWSDRNGNGVDRHLVFLTDDGCDIKFYLDTSSMDDSGECPVVAIGPGYPGVLVGSTFLGFLARLYASGGKPLAYPTG